MHDDEHLAHATHAYPSGEPPPRSRSRAARVLLAIGAALGLLLTFVIALAVGAVIHAGLPPARRIVAAEVNRALAGTFEGRLVVERVGALGLGGISGGRALALDPEGRTVLVADGVRARVRSWALVRSLVRGDDVALILPDVSVDHVEATLVPERDGSPSLARAFSPRPTEAAPAPERPSRGVDVDLPRVRVRHAWVHGTVGTTPIDADVADLAAHARVAPLETDLALDGVAVTARAPTPREALVTAWGRAHLPSKGDAVADAQVRATIGGVRVTAEAGIDGKRVHATVDVPTTDPRAVREILPSAPVYRPAALHAEASGTLPRIRPRVHATAGTATVDAEGVVTLPDGPAPLRAEVDVRAQSVDLRAFTEGGPPSRLGGSAHATVAVASSGALDGSYALSTEAGAIAGQRVPPLEARGTFTQTRVSGRLRVDDPGLPVALDFALHPAARDRVVDFDVRTNGLELTRVPRVGSAAGGSVDLRAQGRLDLVTQAITADLHADARDVKSGAFDLERAVVDARARGTLPRLTLDASVALTRAGTTVSARAEGVKVAGGAVDAPALVVTGLGDPLHAGVHVAAGRTRVAVQAPDVDIARLVAFTGASDIARSGHLALDADVDVRGREARGRAEVNLRDADVWLLKGARAHVAAWLGGRSATAHARVMVPDTLDVQLDAPDIGLDGSPLAGASWARSTGEASIDARVNLEKVLHLVPEAQRTLGELAGDLEVHGKAKRATRAGAPALDVKVATRGLVAAALTPEEIAPDGTPRPGTAPWRTHGLDVDLTVHADEPTQQAHVSCALLDAKKKAVASLTADTRLPEALTRGAALRTALETAPVDARLVLPRRALRDLPSILPRPPFDGDAELTVDLHGTLAAPDVKLAARGWALRAPRDVSTRPFDTRVDASYDGTRATADAHFFRADETILSAHADLALASRDLLAGDTSRWTAGARATFHDFPLQSVSAVGDRQIKGNLAGSFALERLHEDAAAEARLQLTELKIGAARFPSASATLTARDGTLDARVRFDAPDGFGDARATAGVAWGRDVTPSLVKSRPLDVRFDAKHLRAAFAKPLLEGTFSELDGLIDANVHAVANLETKGGQFTGAIVLTKGVLEIPTIGSELHDAHARIDMKPWGTIRFTDVGADGVTGHMDASGAVKLEGIRFVSAEAHVTIDTPNKMPLTLEGVEMGDVYGNVNAKIAAAGEGRIDVEVDVPKFHLQLPQSTGHPVQPLDPDDTIQVGTRRPDGRFVSLLLEPPTEERKQGATAVHVVVKLGDDVEIRRDHTLRAVVTGAPVVDVTDMTRISGQITLVSGLLEVQGKRFKIEKGTVSFTGQPTDNPVVVATAVYDAPDGTHVFADFTGPLKTGKVTLRSEPQHTEDEILAILLFGSADGSLGASMGAGGGESAATRATSLGGNFVAQGVNRALAGFTSVDIATRVDTSQSGNPRPELQVQVSKDVTVQVSYSLGMPNPWENPDRTLLMLDWRFVRQWVLETTIGDRGSSWVDVLWRYRY